MTIRQVIITVCVAVALVSCEKKAQLPSNKYSETDSTSEKIVEMNTMLSDMEDEDIKAYVKKSGKKFRTTGTGVRLWFDTIDDRLKGDSIKDGDVVRVSYKVSLTDGTGLYDHTGKQSETLEVGKGRRQTGLSEGLMSMREGDHTILVVPSILAYGALGDRNKIPPRATLVYDIQGIKRLANK